MTELEAVDTSIEAARQSAKIEPHDKFSISWRFYCMLLDAYLDRYLGAV